MFQIAFQGVDILFECFDTFKSDVAGSQRIVFPDLKKEQDAEIMYFRHRL